MTRSTFRFRSRTSKALAAGLLLLAACGALASPLSPAPLHRALPFLAFAERHDAAPATPATADAKAAPAVQENRLGNSLAPAAASAALVAPNVTATKTDAFSAPFAEPGEEINYTVTVTNNGSSDAEGVQFNDTPDPNTTLVPGSIQTTVVAVNNTYASIGNVGISVDANNGLLANDSDPDGDVLTASAAATTAQGGDLSVNTDGGFSYSPAPGFEGTDSFTYTVTDVDGNTDSGVVTIAVSGMIWFVNPSAPSGGDGRLTTPFNALTGPGSFDASAADEPGDNIFLYSGTHTGGLLLKSSQRLVGAAAPASLDTIAGVVVPAFSNPLPSTGGASPVIASAGDGLVLGSNNALWGFTVGNSTGADIIGSGFGTLVVRGVQISGTGQAVNLDNGTLDAQFGTVEVTNRTTTGLFMNNIGGTADFGATSIDNALNVGGYGIRIENSSAAVAFASADISNSNVTVPQTDTDSNGLPDSEGDGDAIFLTNNTGSFSLNGGSLTGCGNDCIDVRNSQNLTLANVTVSTPGADVLATAIAGLGGHGVQAVNLTGTNVITGSTVTQFNDNNADGVRYVSSVPTASTLAVTGSTFSNATGANGINVIGRDDAQMALTVGGPTNESSTNCTFTGLRGAAVSHAAGANVGSTATVDITVQNSSFQNAQTNGLSGVNARNLEGGKAAVVVKGNTFDTVGQTSSSNTGVINVSGDGTLASNLLSVAIEGNTLNNIGRAANTCGTGTANCIGPRGIQVFIDDHTKVSGNVVVDGNTLTNVRRDGVFLDFNNSATGSDVNARVTGNTIGTDAARVGQVGQSGLRIFRRCFNFSQCGRSANVLVENNTIRNGSGAVASATTGPGLYSSTEDNASLNLVVLNNNIETNSTGPAEERSETRFPVGAGSTMCLNMGGDGSAGQANTLASGAGAIFLNEAAGTTLNVEQASTAALASANGIPAGNVTLTGTPQFGVSCSAPPSAWFNSATPAGQFYAGDATKNAGQSASAARALGLLRNNRVALLLAANEAAMPAGGKLALGSAFGYAREAAPVRVGANDDVLKTTTAHARARSAAALAAAVAYSGTVSLDIGTLPATKSMTITFKVTVNNTLNAAEISNQGQVSGTNFPAVLTDDPDTAAPNDPTVTPAGSPAEITCPADITVNTDPNAFSASVSFSTTATGSPNPTVECKVGATVINSPHTFPVGTTSVQCTATNGIGAADSCSFNVTVNDNQTPVINCPANIVTTTDANSCAANVSVGTPTATDNDPNLNVAGTRSDGQPLNAPYPKGTTTITWTATDTAGNSASCQQTVTVNDDDAPVVSCPANIVVTLPANSSTAPVTFAAPTATDNCHNSLPVTLSHASGSQFPVGTTTVTASATDAAGNTGSCSFTVTVVYNFTGFFSPVANLPTFNKANAGQAIPVKFSLGGNQGLNIFAPGHPASGQIACDSSAEPNVIEETITAGGSSLSYDAATGVYTYIWKTEKTWKDSCRQLVVVLADGSAHRANFQFK